MRAERHRDDLLGSEAAGEQEKLMACDNRW
jgi:hypothetical protein